MEQCPSRMKWCITEDKDAQPLTYRSIGKKGDRATRDVWNEKGHMAMRPSIGSEVSHEQVHVLALYGICQLLGQPTGHAISAFMTHFGVLQL